MSISTPNRATNASPGTLTCPPAGLPEHLHDFIRKPGRLLIDGNWLEAASAKTFETLDPATEETLGSRRWATTRSKTTWRPGPWWPDSRSWATPAVAGPPPGPAGFIKREQTS